MIKSGARILENACGPCIGIGQAPPTDAVSLRTFNRNFRGRSGTQSAKVYLVSPETAVASAIYGEITDPRKLGKYPIIDLPRKLSINANMFISPANKSSAMEIVRGPNIKPMPRFQPVPDKLTGEVLLKVGDNITTDDILPGGSEIMSLRSNIPEISEYAFHNVDGDFSGRALAKRGGFIIGGENYGQGSSREHAAIVLRYLGVKAVVAKSFGRIHLANLVNFGVVPMTFVSEEGYSQISQGDVLDIEINYRRKDLILKNRSTCMGVNISLDLRDREIDIVKAGGRLPFIEQRQKR